MPSPKVVLVAKEKVLICLAFRADVLSTQIKQRLGELLLLQNYCLLITVEAWLNNKMLTRSLLMPPTVAFINSHVHAEADTYDGQNGFCLLGFPSIHLQT